MYVLLFIANSLLGVDIGSDSAVTRFNTQQSLADGDRIAGFAALFGGFALSGSETTGIFDSFFQVSGDIALNFGTLVLNQDLIIQDEANIRSIGQINGNGRTLELSSQVSQMPFLDSSLSSCGIALLTSNAASDQVNSVDWNSTGEYVAIATNDPGGATDQVEIYGWDGTTLTLITGVDIIDNVFSVRWHPTNDWIAVARNGGVFTPFQEVYIYSFNGTTLTLLDSLTLVADTANAVSWRPDGNFLGVATNVVAGELRVYPVSGGGILGTPITANLAQAANDVSWNGDGTFLATVTDNDAGGNELLIYAFNGVTLTFDIGANITAATNTVSWNKGGSNTDIIAVGSEVGTGSTLKLYRHSTGVLTALALSISTSTPVNAVHWKESGDCLAVGLDTNVDGEVRIYEFALDDISLASDLERAANVFDVRWSVQGNYLASGSSAPAVSVYQPNSDFSTVIFSNLNLFLNNDLDLNSPSITFTGESSINGRGKTLSLSPTFSFIVDAESSLLLKNMTLAGVQESSFKGVDALSTFSFQDVNLVLESNFTFTLGLWDILGDLVISGTHTVTYTSDQNLIIRGDRLGSDACNSFYKGSLILEEGVTFNYMPLSGSSDLILMESPLSRLFLKGANFIASNVTLTKGTVCVDGKSMINGLTNITLGDGLLLENNCCLEIYSAANLDVFGTLIYNNI